MPERSRDCAQVHSVKLDKEMVQKALALLEIDTQGLTASDRNFIDTIINKFHGGPVGLNTLSAATSEEMSTIEEVSEPYLIRLVLFERTPRGRMATQKAYDHLKATMPKNRQRKLP